MSEPLLGPLPPGVDIDHDISRLPDGADYDRYEGLPPGKEELAEYDLDPGQTEQLTVYSGELGVTFVAVDAEEAEEHTLGPQDQLVVPAEAHVLLSTAGSNEPVNALSVKEVQ